MTSHYLDITIRPSPEISQAQLLGALYDRVHLHLVSTGANDIGISFPGYSLSPKTLGTVLRLHGSEHSLQAWIKPTWLKAMRDHVYVGNVLPVPQNTNYRTVSRRQFKTNVERLRRRRMKRKGETAEQAKAAIPDSVARKPDLPFVHLHSRSTRQPFCLFIQLGSVVNTPKAGTFTGYGLCKVGTIPWF